MTARKSQAAASQAVQDERRVSPRFEVPGASLAYRSRGILRRGSAEEFCPLENLSRGGLKMLCRNPLRPGRRLDLRVSFSEDDIALEWTGRVAWIFPVRDADFAFSVGVQFNPAEGQPGPKAAALRAALDTLEKKYGRG